MKRVLRRAGFHVFLRSVSKTTVTSYPSSEAKRCVLAGVEVVDDADEVPCYVWAEPELTDEQVTGRLCPLASCIESCLQILISAHQAWSCWAFLKIMRTTNPNSLSLLGGIASSYV